MKDFSPDVCDCLPPCTTRSGLSQPMKIIKKYYTVLFQLTDFMQSATQKRQPEAGLIEYGRYKFVDELASKIDIGLISHLYNLPLISIINIILLKFGHISHLTFYRYEANFRSRYLSLG